MTDRVGFIGLGRMGRPMAANLQRKGVQLTVFDIVATPMAVLVQLGARQAASLAAVVENSDVVVTMLPGSPEVEDVVLGADGVLAHARPGMLVMDMSTVDPATTDALTAAAAKHDASVVDAPVGRLASHADAGESLFMVGASQADFARIRPLLEAMGTRIHHCGSVGSGIRTKLINNFLAIVACQMNAEALAQARAAREQAAADMRHVPPRRRGRRRGGGRHEVPSPGASPASPRASGHCRDAHRARRRIQHPDGHRPKTRPLRRARSRVSYGGRRVRLLAAAAP